MNPARQAALWTKLEMFNTTRNVALRVTRKRSENRQRTERVNVRLLPSELEVLGNAADVAGITIAELMRRASLKYANAFEYSLRARRNDED
jgi:hypothetical protein